MYYTYGHYTADKTRLFYIGKGKKNRMHEKSSRSNHWRSIVEKYGLHVELLAKWETEEEAFEHEKFLIECFRPLTKLCNLTDGGEGISGYVVPEEILYKWSKKPHNTGKHWSEEVKKKLRDAQIGIPRGPQSKEHSAKIGNALRGKPKSPEHIAKMSEKAKLQSKVLKTCPHCGHQNYGANIYRWHFDNCKAKHGT